MDKKKLKKVISDIFTPLGFKQKGSTWICENGLVTKIVQLQKSNFQNAFYFNYGYILKSLPLDREIMHVYNRLGSKDMSVAHKISDALNLECEISEMDRCNFLGNIIKQKIIAEFDTISSELDLAHHLKDFSNLNTITLRVKKHLHIG